jgi:Ca-activated chloride channel family protein
LTHDLGAFELFLDHVNFESLPLQGTSLSEALKASAKALEDGSEAETKGKAVILISDGEDHEGQAIEVAKGLAERGIVIHTIGVGGQEGAPIPLADGGFMKDASGHMIVSQPNESILKSIAEAGHGRFVRAANGDFDLAETYSQFIRPDLKEGEHSSREKIWQEQHQGFSALSLLLFSLDAIWIFARLRSRKSQNLKSSRSLELAK